MVVIRNRFGDVASFVENYNTKYNTEYEYNSYYRSKEQRQNIGNLFRKEEI